MADEVYDAWKEQLTALFQEGLATGALLAEEDGAASAMVSRWGIYLEAVPMAADSDGLPLYVMDAGPAPSLTSDHVEIFHKAYAITMAEFEASVIKRALEDDD